MARRVGTVLTLLAVVVTLCLEAVYVHAGSESGQSIVIEDIPHIYQKPDFCGEACAAMALQKLGKPLDQDYVFDQSGLDPLAARGCYTKELAHALGRIGFDIGPVWHRVSPQRAKTDLENQWRILRDDLAAGTPSIVCMHYDASPHTPEHFRLIVGHDVARDEVVYHEPAERRGDYRRMKRSTFL